MHLLLSRAQRDDGWIWNSMTFLLDVRLELTAEENELFERYDLHSVVVYDSDARIQHAHSAVEHIEKLEKPVEWRTGEKPIEDLVGILGDLSSMLWNTTAGVTHGVISMMSLQITLGSLVAGQHFESQDLNEILTVAENISAATKYLADYLEVAITFDGREQLDEY